MTETDIWWNEYLEEYEEDIDSFLEYWIDR